MSAPVFKYRPLSFAVLLLAAGMGSPASFAQTDDTVATETAAAAATEKTEHGFELQVLARQLKIYDAPSETGAVISGVIRGQIIHADQQQGDWFRIPVASASAQGFGWVRHMPDEYDDTTLNVQPARATQQDPLLIGTAETDPLLAGAISRNTINGQPRSIAPAPQYEDQIAPPDALLPREFVPVPDRWRIMQALDFRFPFFDPYNQNVLKGDLPVAPEHFPEWFFNLGLISDTTYEMRRIPVPVAPQTSGQPGAYNLFGQGDQSTLIQNVIVSLGLTKGNTTFRPPDYEFRFVPVFQYNQSRVEEVRLLRVDPRTGYSRTDNFVAIQELFFDKHLRNVSDRYDFDSLRIGIQPIQADFRGFLFQDNALGIRLFGTRDNNHWQYNLAWFRRLEKDTNSGLNDLSQRPREDDVFLFNLYRQDFPRVGFTSQVSVIHNRNREDAADYYDDNGFLVRPAVNGDVRPHDYQVTYLGYNGDGHFGRNNLTTSFWLALGEDERNPVAQQKQSIEAFFFASELSRDFDWIRLRGNFLYASGDKDPFNDTAAGFDAILENPQFAGADTSFFIRQAVPLVGGGGVALSGRNGILPSLRSSKDKGQSNFVNPGLTLLGVGADFDVLPTLRVLSNVSYLRFNETEVLGVLRNQAAPNKELGVDISTGLQFRPLYSQNIVITASFAALMPGKGLRELYPDEQTVPLYSALLNVLLAF
ncbi:MAG: hypothetical protein ACRERR_14455 [Moraxellaceae bacterium]